MQPPARNLKPDFDQLDAGELVKQLTFARSNKPDFPAGFVDRLQPVGLRLVRPEDAEVAHVQPHDFPEEVAEGGDGSPEFFDGNGGIAEVGQI
jgi:hypothetical protein